MSVLHGYIPIAICRYIYVDLDLELEDQIAISGEINNPPLHSVLNANSRGIQSFKGAHIFVPGSPKISIKLK